MFKSITGKIYPNTIQVESIQNTFNHTRFVWNTYLGMLSDRYTNNNDLSMPSYNALSSLLPTLKAEHPWLKGSDSIAVQNTVKTLRETFDRFFNHTSGYPKFKSKRVYAKSYRTTIRGNSIRFNERQTYLKLPKLGWVKIHKSVRHVNNDLIKSVTVKQYPNGSYGEPILIEHENQVLDRTNQSVGIDVGVSDLAITSDGVKYPTRRLYREFESQLHYWETRMARRRVRAIRLGIPLSECKGYQKARIRVATIHQKMTNIRTDRLHKITSELIQSYDMIALEDLKVSNMMNNHHLARAIAEQSWSQLRAMLVLKGQSYGRDVILVDPRYTSQICSTCGHSDGKKPLDVRVWVCSNCGDTHDRDINAAINIRNIGLGQALVR